MSKPIFDAREMLKATAERHGIRFEALIAETGLWASPEVHRTLIEAGSAAWFPGVRRKRGAAENRGETVDGITFDDNTKANQAIKLAVGYHRKQLVGFETCHIWPETCYDPACHTAIANLVLLPRALAGFSDHDPAVSAALKFRAFELYGWHPAGAMPPERPQNYPVDWRPAEDFSDAVRNALSRRRRADRAGENDAEIGASAILLSGGSRPRTEHDALFAAADMGGAERNFVVRRIELWATKPGQISHKIVAIVADHEPNGISRTNLIDMTKSFSRNPGGAIDSLRRSDGNAYGRVLAQSPDGTITVHPAVKDVVRTKTWFCPSTTRNRADLSNRQK
jgi:hypothetical protein